MQLRDDIVAGLALACIIAGLALAAGCEPLVDNSTDQPAPVTVVVSNASPGVYVHSGDGSTITIGDSNEIGIAPDNSVTTEAAPQ